MVSSRLNSPTASDVRQLPTLAWQGWELTLPDDWAPIKVDGNFDRGFVAIADLDRERLGLRWQTVGPKVDPRRVVDDNLRGEVGQLAFDESAEATSDDWPISRVYVEPDPPGRDVWIGFSAATNRVLQVVYHATGRDRLLRDSILPNLRDQGEAGGARRWAIFWASAVLPRPMKLLRKRLNVGDLAISFDTGKGPLEIRQMAAANMVLNRRPLDAWLGGLGEPKRYRPIGDVRQVEWPELDRIGVCQDHARRRRLFFARWLPAGFVVYAVHDRTTDRLILVRAPDAVMAQAVIEQIASTRG
jgi:hypothetical protein